MRQSLWLQLCFKEIRGMINVSIPTFIAHTSSCCLYETTALHASQERFISPSLAELAKGWTLSQFRNHVTFNLSVNRLHSQTYSNCSNSSSCTVTASFQKVQSEVERIHWTIVALITAHDGQQVIAPPFLCFVLSTTIHADNAQQFRRTGRSATFKLIKKVGKDELMQKVSLSWK